LLDKETNYYQLLSLDSVFVEPQTISEAYASFKAQHRDDLEALSRAK
jgi:hypothetical protein